MISIQSQAREIGLYSGGSRKEIWVCLDDVISQVHENMARNQNRCRRRLAPTADFLLKLYKKIEVKK